MQQKSLHYMNGIPKLICLLAYSRSPVSSAKAKLCILYNLLEKITEGVYIEQKDIRIKHFHSSFSAALCKSWNLGGLQTLACESKLWERHKTTQNSKLTEAA